MKFAAEIVTLLAGAFAGAMLRRKDPKPDGAWRAELEDLGTRLSSRLAMHDGAVAEMRAMQRRLVELAWRFESAQSEFARLPDLAAGQVKLSGAMDAQERRIVALEQAVDAHTRKWESADRVTAALKEKTIAAMAEMDRRLALQENRIEDLNTAAADAGGKLARVLDSLESLSRIARERAEPLRVRATEPASLASLIADEAGVGKLRHIRL